MHPNLTTALAEDRRKFCTCGAVNGQRAVLCRMCRARRVWHYSSRLPGRAVRRRAGRRTSGRAWIFPVAASTLRTIGKGAKG